MAVKHYFKFRPLPDLGHILMPKKFKHVYLGVEGEMGSYGDICGVKIFDTKTGKAVSLWLALTKMKYVTRSILWIGYYQHW